MDATALLRDGVLAGQVVARSGDGAFGTAVGDACARLGATVGSLTAEDAEAFGPVHTLVVDATEGPAGEAYDWLGPRLDRTWSVVRAVANAAMIPGEAGGKIVLVAPAPDPDAPEPAALAAALENLARTASIEWARYGIRPTAILPGPRTTTDEVAALAAYLASPAGDYYSGCALTLGGPR